MRPAAGSSKRPARIAVTAAGGWTCASTNAALTTSADTTTKIHLRMHPPIGLLAYWPISLLAAQYKSGIVRDHENARSGRGHYRCLRAATGAAATHQGADAGDSQDLRAGNVGAPSEANRRGLADDPAFVRRVGLQSTRSDHARQRQPARTGVGVLHRRQQWTRS